MCNVLSVSTCLVPRHLPQVVGDVGVGDVRQVGRHVRQPRLRAPLRQPELGEVGLGLLDQRLICDSRSLLGLGKYPGFQLVWYQGDSELIDW